MGGGREGREREGERPGGTRGEGEGVSDKGREGRNM